MDLRAQVLQLIERAFHDSFPDAPKATLSIKDWRQRSLTEIFPEPETLSKFIGNVIRATLVLQAQVIKEGYSPASREASERWFNGALYAEALPQKNSTLETLAQFLQDSIERGNPEGGQGTGGSGVPDVHAPSPPSGHVTPPDTPTPRPPATSPPPEALARRPPGSAPPSGGAEPSHPGSPPRAPAPPYAVDGSAPETYTSIDTGGMGSRRPEENTSVVRAFYATDRGQVLEGGLHFDADRSASGKINYGECLISFPKIHKKGHLETPSILKLEFRPDPKKHIILQSIQSFEEAVFLERLAAQVSASATKEAFIFVHGYYVSFEDAARRTGQLAFDLEFVGAPIFYSWPSNGKFADYFKDEANVTWSTPHFQRFLSLISQRSGATRVHIIAHSMGNRAVCDALKALSADPNNNVKFNHLVLAAPDIDADTFRELAAALQKVSGLITLYESTNDKAIHASKKIHGSPRAGEPLLIIPGLDTVDASKVDTDFLGHSYFGETWTLLADIHSILSDDKPAGRRFGLRGIDDPAGKYYVFKE
jgi:esterase/lipase superfamily enzyme